MINVDLLTKIITLIYLLLQCAIATCDLIYEFRLLKRK